MIGARASHTSAIVLALALGCGARTSLEIEPPLPDAGPDAPPCVPSVETCNGRDDDCDGRSDEAMPLVALGPPIVLRDETELDAGDCSTCFWAWSPILTPLVGGGWQSIFRISIYGGREEPNLFVRSLDAHGVPTGPNLSAGPDVALDLEQLDTPRPGDTAIAACWRVGSDDLPGLLLVRPDGSRTHHVYRDARYCESMVLAGDRVLAVEARDHRANVWSRRIDGSDRRSGTLDLSEVYFAVADGWRGRVGVVLLRIEDDERLLWFTALHPTGETAVRPLLLDVPYESYPRIIGTSEGWLVVTPGRSGAPARVLPLTPNGSPLGPLEPFDDGHPLADAHLGEAFVHHPTERSLVHVFYTWDGVAPAATLEVQVLDERGRTLRAFEMVAPGSGAVASPSVAFADDGRLLVAWHDIADDSTRNRVFALELGCAP